MKPLPILVRGEPDHLNLNIALRENGHGMELLPRCVPLLEGKTPSELSYIGFCSQTGVYRSDCIVPTGETVGYEDAACIGKGIIACNRTVRVANPITGESCLKPIPSIFYVDGKGNATALGEISGKLADLFCKGFTPLNRNVALIRPIFDDSDGTIKENPRVLLCRWNRLKRESLEVVPEAVFLRARPSEGIGISAPPVQTPYGPVLVYHRIIWDKDRVRRQYRHYPLLMDREHPWLIRAHSNIPIVTSCMFPLANKCWIEGATYFRNLLYDPLRDSLHTVVTESDVNNYWLEIPLANILRGMREYRNAELVSSAFSFCFWYWGTVLFCGLISKSR